MIKLVVSDMDGTLLNKSNRVTKESVNAIQKMQEQGKKFVIITGRDPEEMKKFWKETGIVCDVLCANGACVLSSDGSVKYKHMLSYEQVEKISNVFEQYDLVPTFYSDKGAISLLLPHEYFIHLKEVMVPAFQLLVPNAIFTDEDLMDIVKQTIFTKKDHLKEYEIFKVITKSVDLERLYKAKEEVKKLSGILSVSTSKAYIEANEIKAQKGIALKEYAKEHGISLEEVIAIGDNENDSSMLSIPEIQSVAMGNAIEEVKNVCKYETKTNDEDGVAYVIHHLI